MSTPAQTAALYEAASARLEATRVAYSLVFQKFETLQAQYATLIEDPTAVTPESLQAILAELDVFREEYNAFAAEATATTAEIAALPDGTFKTTLQTEDQQLRTQRTTTLNSTLVPFRDSVRAEAARVTREAAERERAETVARAEAIVDYRAEQNDGSGPGDEGTWYVIGENGEIAPNGTNLTQQAAQLLADELNLGPEDADLTVPGPENQADANQYRAVFNDGTGPGPVGTWYVLGPKGETSFSGKSQAAAEEEAERLNAAQALSESAATVTPEQRAAAEATVAASRQQELKNRLQQQAARAAQRKQANEGDWRVKLRLAENANYLYRDPALNEQGILWPLAITNGVIFPYTPQISTTYNASYTDQALTHSNYKGYFYQSSHVGEISIQAQFTAQDTSEANYLLAVIHFFRSATKMFYGQDAQRGSPPPLVFLQGLGEMQFNLHPCVISTFQYSLPSDVDYIRARTANIAGSAQDSLIFRRARQTTTSNPYNASDQRLNSAGLQPGARTTLPGPGTLGVGDATQGPTYVPTKMDITLSLLPMQTRTQQSQQFSVRDFANGNLQRGGFW